jgi:hypothetical protein
MTDKKIFQTLCISIFLCLSQTFLFSVTKSVTDDNFTKPKAVAEWTIMTYIQADNNLSSYASYNINDMQFAKNTNNVNILVQWDQPSNNKTWRYKIEKNVSIEVGSLNQEMGINPEKEIVAMMQWAKDNYPAKKYMLIFWNHGNGVIDRNKKLPNILTPWIQIPGSSFQTGMIGKDRGILYDDTQGTFLTNAGLRRALKSIKENVLKKKIDIVGMDACLMAMIEIVYQIRNYAKYFVGSEHTEPGYGWSYSGFLIPLIKNPSSYNALALAKKVVNAYKNFYSWDDERTQSAIKLSKVNTVKNGINRVISSLATCESKDKTRTKSMISYARHKAVDFYFESYIDLYSFYSKLRNKANTYITNKSGSSNFRKSLSLLKICLTRERNYIRNAVVRNTVGSNFKSAKGISIYYPTNIVDSTYLNTKFAKNTSWIDFINSH